MSSQPDLQKITGKGLVLEILVLEALAKKQPLQGSVKLLKTHLPLDPHRLWLSHYFFPLYTENDTHTFLKYIYNVEGQEILQNNIL